MLTETNAIKTNGVKVKIHNTQQNIKHGWYSDKDEMVNPIISEGRKLAQKEWKTSLDWMGMIIHWELCKRLKFGHTNKWYIHKPEVFSSKMICITFSVNFRWKLIN